MSSFHLLGMAERKAKIVYQKLRKRLAAGPSYYHGSSTTQSQSHTPKIVFSVIFAFVYLLVVLRLGSHNYNDPTSFFFDSERGYEKGYSEARGAQAQAFLDTAALNVSTASLDTKSSAKPKMCVGIATVKRSGEQYIRHTMGSVLEGLSASERSSIHLIFFIAHTDPSVHEVYDEPWTRRLPDTALSYDVDEATRAQIQRWEEDKNYIRKGLFDYSYLLSACAATEAPYIAMLEGDILAARGWLPHALRAAEAVDDLAGAHSSLSDGRGDSDSDVVDGPSSPYIRPAWLYLRLFYTETYLGWNSEFWPLYLLSSLGVAFVLLASLVFVRAMFPARRLAYLLSNPTLLVLALAFLPACILLYFAAGRVSMRPLPAGPQRMEGFGCCSQAFVFPTDNVPLVKAKIEARGKPFMDMLMEQTAEQEGLERWALAPSLFQHVGSKSSKGDPVADANARKIWNFAFERLDAEKGVGELQW